MSIICKLIDETPLTWDEQGVEAAVKQVLNEQNTLFDDMIKKLNDYPEVIIMLRKVLFEGQPISNNIPMETILNMRNIAFWCGSVRVVRCTKPGL